MKEVETNIAKQVEQSTPDVVEHNEVYDVENSIAEYYHTSDHPGTRILLIDQDESSARLIYNTLFRSTFKPDFSIGHVTCYYDAVALLTEDPDFDIILLDYVQPDIHVLNALDELKSDYPNIAVIVLTDFEDPQTTKEAMKMGAQDYLIKDHFGGGYLKRAVEYAIERKKNSNDQADHHFKYRYIFENSVDAIYMSTFGEEKVTEFNQAFIDLFGYTQPQLEDMDIANLYLEKSDIVRFVKQFQEAGFVKDFRTVMVKKNGEHIHCVISSIVRKDINGKVTGYQGIIRDITEQVKARMELEEMNRMLEDKVAKRTKELRFQNTMIEAQNEELKEVIGALQKAKISRKAITIVFMIAIALFFLAEGVVEPFIDDWAYVKYGEDSGLWVGLGVKALMLLLLKPIEMLVEAAVRRNSMKSKLKITITDTSLST